MIFIGVVGWVALCVVAYVLFRGVIRHQNRKDREAATRTAMREAALVGFEEARRRRIERGGKPIDDRTVEHWCLGCNQTEDAAQFGFTWDDQWWFCVSCRIAYDGEDAPEDPIDVEAEHVEDAHPVGMGRVEHLMVEAVAQAMTEAIDELHVALLDYEQVEAECADAERELEQAEALGKALLDERR